MGRTVYRVLLVILLVYFPLQGVVDILVVASRHSAHPSDLSYKLLVFALLLDPVSAVGLWYERRWGAAILGLSMVLIAFTPMWGMAFWNLGILGLAGLRFIQARKEVRSPAIAER
jgi:hypothetical protein